MTTSIGGGPTRSSTTTNTTNRSESTRTSGADSGAKTTAKTAANTTAETSAETTVERLAETSAARVRDELQTTERKAEELRARELVGGNTALRAPDAALASTAALGQVRPKRGLTGADAPATDAAAVDAPATEGSASVDATADAAPAEPASVVATQVNDMAATDPEGAARLYADTIEANPDPAYRAELTDAAQPGLETIGDAAARGGDSTDGIVRELSRASEALHAGGQPDVARNLADGFARGTAAASEQLSEEHNMPIGASPDLGDAFEAQAGSGTGANFAADVTSSLADTTRAAVDAGADYQDVQRLENLTGITADGMSRGLHTLEERFRSQGEDIAERSSRLEEAEERYGPYLSDEQRAAAQADTAVETEAMVREYDATAGQLTAAVEASARAYDSLDAAAEGHGHLLASARNSVSFAMEGAVGAMPAAAATLTGQAAMADTVAAQAAGERTWLDTVADMRADGWATDDTARSAFAAATQGAALLGATDYGAGGTLDRARGAIAHNAAALLDEDGRAAVDEALAQMEGAGSSVEAFDRFARSLEENEDALGGPQVANALGAMGTMLSKPEVISEHPSFGRFSRAAGVLASAAGLALSGPGDSLEENVKFGLAAASTAADAAEWLAPGTRLGTWAGVAGRFLGAAGAAWGLVDAIGQGDAIGVASSGLALYGALALNPYAAVAAGVIEGGRFLWNVRQDAEAQQAVDSEYLQGAGITPENAEFIAGIGNYGPPILGENGRRHSGIDDLNERIEHYRNGGDYGAVLMLEQLESS